MNKILGIVVIWKYEVDFEPEKGFILYHGDKNVHCGTMQALIISLTIRFDGAKMSKCV